jgi:hypothetical protein
MRGHRSSDAVPYPIALGLGQTAEEAHQQVVRLGLGIDSSADFRHPKADAVMDENWKHEAELVPRERALRLSDHEINPRSILRAKVLQELRGSGSAFPRQRTRLIDVVIRDHDLTVDLADELLGKAELPRRRIRRRLMVVGAGTQIRGEGPHAGRSSELSQSRH